MINNWPDFETARSNPIAGPKPAVSLQSHRNRLHTIIIPLSAFSDTLRDQRHHSHSAPSTSLNWLVLPSK